MKQVKEREWGRDETSTMFFTWIFEAYTLCPPSLSTACFVSVQCSCSVVARNMFQLMVVQVLCNILQWKVWNIDWVELLFKCICPSASLVVGSYCSSMISYLTCSLVWSYVELIKCLTFLMNYIPLLSHPCGKFKVELSNLKDPLLYLNFLKFSQILVNIWTIDRSCLCVYKTPIGRFTTT